MELQFLGSGGAFTTENYHSNMVLTDDNGYKLLIDCGTDIRHSLKEAGLNFQDFDAIYISHLHGDHAGGLEFIGFASYFTPDCPKPTVFISKLMAAPLWNQVLSGSMSSVQGKIVDINDYFNMMKIGTHGKFSWSGIEFQLVQTLHIMNGFNFVPSFGLLFEMNGKKVFLTSDTQHCPHQISDFYEMANMIFHDCETAPYMSGVHAHFNELKTLPDETKAKMWLYHHNDGIKPNADEAGFQGFVEKGQIFK